MTTTTTQTPTLEPRSTSEPIHTYGLRALTFVCAHGAVGIAQLSTSDLELIDHVYPVAIARPDIEPRIVDWLSGIRRHVLSVIADRQRRLAALAAAVAAVPLPELVAPAPNGPGGSTARLRRPVPVMPPSGAAVRGL